MTDTKMYKLEMGGLGFEGKAITEKEQRTGVVEVQQSETKLHNQLQLAKASNQIIKITNNNLCWND